MIKFAALAFSLLLALAARSDVLTGKVVKVSDGDTIHVQPKSGKREKIRLLDIDAPESDQKWGKQATACLQRRIGGKTVKVEWHKRDQFDRILGYVFLDGNNINLEMVSTGNAWLYRFSNNSAIAAAMQAAKAAKLGLWSLPNPIDPYDWRKRKGK